MPEKTDKRLEIMQNRINQYDIRFPVATLVEKTGLDKGYISAVLKGKKPISDNFWTKFNDAFPEKVDQKLNAGLMHAHENGTGIAAGKPSGDPYTKLLEDNDRFFKTTYLELVSNLGKLFDQNKNLESLIKINLEHTGTVEALHKGVPPDEIHVQINNEILNEARRQRDSGADT